MFVSVINTNTDEVGSHTTIYECTSVHFHQSNEENDAEAILLTLERRNDKALEIVVDKVTHEVYVMNDAGKTIDSYTWSTKR